jgi:hypothetical protein
LEWTYLLPLIVIFLIAVVGAIAGGASNAEARALPSKFVALGDISGKPIEDIVKAVGPATSISAAANGMLYQWHKVSAAGGAHYAILVDTNGKAIGYTHQHVS